MSKNRRVLIAEDDHDIRTMLRVLLVRNGFMVDAVSDGAQALEMISKTNYHVFVLDLLMPQMSGMTVIERLAQQNSSLLARTILTTGVADGLIKGLGDHGFFGVFHKPFDINALLSAISTCGDRAVHGEEREGETEPDPDPRQPKFAGTPSELRRMLSAPAIRSVHLLQEPGIAGTSRRPRRGSFESFMLERFGNDRTILSERRTVRSFIEPDE